MNFDSIKKGLIVSCQALEHEPLHSSYIMSRMAVAAKNGGAVGIRANGIEDIKAIKSILNLPIIGIIKKDYPHSDVYITPTFKEVEILALLGVDIIALDATFHCRPNGELLKEIIEKAKKKFPSTKFMADIATIDEAINAEKLGFDFIGTTLHGYTPETKNLDISTNDFKYLKDLLNRITIPVIAEGKIDTPEKAKRVLELGVFSVVVGGAITRPQEITKKFVTKMSK